MTVRVLRPHGALAAGAAAPLAALLAALALAAALLGPVAPAAAAPAPAAVVLAVSSEPLGPEPQPRDAEGNPAVELGGYEDREVPFTWGAAWLLTFLGLAGLAFMGLVWFRAVDRPRRAPARR
ncbi:MAG: hypothetical protein RLZZ353_281 [Actinomycetota bacterium]|jgi:hypothetical protein